MIRAEIYRLIIDVYINKDIIETETSKYVFSRHS